MTASAGLPTYPAPEPSVSPDTDALDREVASDKTCSDCSNHHVPEDTMVCRCDMQLDNCHRHRYCEALASAPRDARECIGFVEKGANDANEG